MDKDKAAVLARKFEDGSKEAFGELYDAYYKRIYNFIYYKTHHKETAEDLVAQVFMKAYRSANSYDAGKGTFQAWIYQIARHAIVDYYRSVKPTLNIEDSWDVGNNADLEKDTDNKLILEKVRSYIAELPSEQRDIIIMRVWQEMSYVEIGEVMGKSEASCKMAFLRAIKKLRETIPEVLAILFIALVFKKYIL